MARHAYAPHLRLTALAAAAGLTCALAAAQGVSQETTVSVGAGVVGGDAGDRTRFGRDNGLRRGGNFGLLDVDHRAVDDSAGVVTTLEGANLLGATREFDARWAKQGDWKMAVNYGQLRHVDPNTVNTGLSEIGTSTAPQVNLLSGGPGSGHDVQLEIRRTRLGLSLSKQLPSDLQVEISVKAENTEGARLSGRGMACPSSSAPGCAPGTGTEAGWAVLLLPEPLNSTHTQVEARLSYAGEKLRISGGYYGSVYANAYSSYTPNVPATLNNPLGSPLPLSAGLQAILNQPMALSPDNKAQQFDLTGSYAFSRRAHGNFKFSRTEATQTDLFSVAGLTGAPAGVNSLNATVVTTQGQVGLSARPRPKLSLQATLRYEDRDDRTPIKPYNVEGSSTYTNRSLSQVAVRGKLQGHYQFDGSTRGGVGADYDSIDRGGFTSSAAIAGVSALRQQTKERGLFGEVRRTFDEYVSASARIVHSSRNGSNWLKDNSGLGVSETADPATIGPTAVYMPTLADRTRDKLRVQGDLQPSEKLTLQLSAEEGRDRYSAPTIYGAPSSHMSLLGVDGTYALTDAWSITGFFNRGRQTTRQARPGGYVMNYANTTVNVGLGAAGKLTSKIELGGNLAVLDDKSTYVQGLDAYAGGDSAVLLAATGGLPDIVYRETSLRLFGKYTIDKSSSLRLDFAYRYSKLDDWTWSYNGVAYVYSDGSTVWQKAVQTASFIGVRYSYRWQ